jgi:2-polyprenyl-3-methyl-5-hydroxy-6-metoxy-1,4-benzoquinol methylase
MNAGQPDPVAHLNELLAHLNQFMRKSDSFKDCVLCGDSSYVEVLVEYTLAPPEGAWTVPLRILKCRGCSLVYLDDHMSDVEEREMYRILGKAKKWSTSEDYSGLCDEKAMLTDKAALVDKYLPESGRGNFLDIGCASGELLGHFTNRGWNLHGVDVARDLVEKGSQRHNLTLFAGTLEEARYESAYFDWVTAFDIVEHLSNPVSTMKEVNRVLKKDGGVIIEVPNENTSFRAMARFLYKSTMGKFQWPLQRVYYLGHLYYYTSATLKKVMREAGFTIADEFTKESYNTKYGCGGLPVGATTKLATGVLVRLDRVRNTGAKLVVYAKKT